MDDYRHILLATDLAPESRHVGARAVELAKRFDARLSLLHVVDYVPLELSNDMMLAEPVDVDGRLVEEARDSLERLAGELGQTDAQRWVVLGSTGAEIKRTAKEHDVDLIVVGSHGRHGLALLLGSTANSVLHSAPCDVLAVRVRDSEA